MARELDDVDLYLIYLYSEKVVQSELKRCEAIEYLKKQISAHTPYSLQMYIDNYRNLRAGRPYGRNMGSQILEYFLENILKDFGVEALNKAIRSVYYHIIIYYKQTGIKQNSDITIGKKFSERYNLDYVFNNNIFEKNEFVEQEKDAEYINNVNILIDDNNIEAHYEKRPKKILKQQKVYERDVKIAVRALANADYLCELDSNHKTFIRRTNNKNYTEPHHLIPISFQDKFGAISLDVDNNIVSLCSTCHNKLHYGKDIREDLYKLYKDREKLLTIAGIKITFEELFKMYN